MAAEQTMAEKLAAAANGTGSTGDNEAGINIPVVQSVSSTTVAGKSKSGTKS